MTHRMIRRFQIKGITTDDRLVVTKQNCAREITNQMKDEGYVPLLDLTPAFSQLYHSENDQFEFVYTMHGVFIGLEDAWLYAGMTDGKLIPNTIRNK